MSRRSRLIEWVGDSAKLRASRCGSIFGGLVVFTDVGGLVLLLYIDHSATRDISSALNASARLMHSGLWAPVNMDDNTVLDTRWRGLNGCVFGTYVVVLLLWNFVTIWCTPSFVVQFHVRPSSAFDQLTDRPSCDDAHSVAHYAWPMIMVTSVAVHPELEIFEPVAEANMRNDVKNRSSKRFALRKCFHLPIAGVDLASIDRIDRNLNVCLHVDCHR